MIYLSFLFPNSHFKTKVSAVPASSTPASHKALPNQPFRKFRIVSVAIATFAAAGTALYLGRNQLSHFFWPISTKSEGNDSQLNRQLGPMTLQEHCETFEDSLTGCYNPYNPTKLEDSSFLGLDRSADSLTSITLSESNQTKDNEETFKGDHETFLQNEKGINQLGDLIRKNLALALFAGIVCVFALKCLYTDKRKRISSKNDHQQQIVNFVKDSLKTKEEQSRKRLQTFTDLMAHTVGNANFYNTLEPITNRSFWELFKQAVPFTYERRWTLQINNSTPTPPHKIAVRISYQDESDKECENTAKENKQTKRAIRLTYQDECTTEESQFEDIGDDVPGVQFLTKEQLMEAIQSADLNEDSVEISQRIWKENFGEALLGIDEKHLKNMRILLKISIEWRKKKEFQETPSEEEVALFNETKRNLKELNGLPECVVLLTVCQELLDEAHERLRAEKFEGQLKDVDDTDKEPVRLCAEESSDEEDTGKGWSVTV